MSQAGSREWGSNSNSAVAVSLPAVARRHAVQELPHLLRLLPCLALIVCPTLCVCVCVACNLLADVDGRTGSLSRVAAISRRSCVIQSMNLHCQAAHSLGLWPRGVCAMWLQSSNDQATPPATCHLRRSTLNIFISSSIICVCSCIVASFRFAVAISCVSSAAARADFELDRFNGHR